MPQTNEQRRQPAYKARRNVKLRQRYATDPTYRAHLLSYMAKTRKPRSEVAQVKSTEATRKWRKENPEKYRVHGQRANLKKFGISVEDYKQMLDAQSDTCAICRKPETEFSRYGVVKMLAVDHNHATGKVRGLLCSSCNTTLGKMNEDPALLRRAAQYLEGF